MMAVIPRWFRYPDKPRRGDAIAVLSPACLLASRCRMSLVLAAVTEYLPGMSRDDRFLTLSGRR